MIEAVSSVLLNSQSLKTATDSVSADLSPNVQNEPSGVQISAPYISPYISVDLNFDRAVIQLREAETGDVVFQIPSEKQLQAYKRAQAEDDKFISESQDSIVSNVDRAPDTSTAPSVDAPKAPIEADVASVDVATDTSGGLSENA